MSDRSQAACKAWETMYKRIYGFTDEELGRFLEDRYEAEFSACERKRVRDIIRDLGGVNDPDFEFIPVWAKRQNGQRLDEIVLEIQDFLPEYSIEKSDDVYELLKTSGV